ncbi:DNA replication protein [Candidatus Phytoplasma luffae]|uniref:DNA replication protein n=1 Tax=Loofah witches'-broom phytoplasma TaxID=35773 RepID=A0A975FI57_LOWBP|nr:DnaD domain protein [Candidatus Phytoplasma luffae]QTX02820.1 DNA replication protein [Candidatus Phytoplasma luffae]
MFKNLYEQNYLNIEKILINKYKNLDLTLQELIILLFLFNSYENKNFSSLFLAEKTNLSKNEVENILEKLLKKNFFSLSEDKKNNKIIEIFDLDNTFIKLEQLYLEIDKKEKTKKNKTYITETIDEIEKLKGENLTPYELEIIKNWYLDNNFQHNDIIQTIHQASLNQKKSIHYIERILNHKKNVQIEKDDKADQILHKIFNKIK